MMSLIPRRFALRDTTDICDILRMRRDISTNKYYGTAFVIFEFH
jgi:hypothetical protein